MTFSNPEGGPLTPRLDLDAYNYDAFVPEKFGPLNTFAESPRVGDVAPDFPLWAHGSAEPTTLSALWKQHDLLVVEFGSFT